MKIQEAFDKIATHLLTQDSKAMDGAGTCCYLTEEGLKCAIGCLIPEEKYDITMEGYGVIELRELDYWMDELQLDDVDEETMMKFYTEMQETHDGFSEDEWLWRMGKIATKYGLSRDVILAWEKQHGIKSN